MSAERIVGIDLGTTNSLVAFMQGDTPVVIPGEDGSNLVPSVVALDENNQTLIGNSASRNSDRNARSRRLLRQTADGARC